MLTLILMTIRFDSRPSCGGHVVQFHLIGPSIFDRSDVNVCESLKKLYSRALLLAVDFEFEHGVNYLLNNKKNFFNITDLTSELILLDEVSI